MFELAKLLADTVLKAIPLSDILSRRDKAKIRHIGAELFALYASLNEVYVVGSGITEEIQKGCGWMQRKLNEGQPDAELSTTLPFLLSQQRVSLLKAVRSVNALAVELNIIDGKSYAALVPLIHGKGNAISDLLDSIAWNEPSLKVYDEATLLAGMQESYDGALSSSNSESSRRPSMMRFGDQFSLTQKARRLSLTGVAHIKASRLPELHAYLEAEKPAERLAELQRILDTFRAALEKNFSVSDILLAVGDRRAGVTNQWVG
jgi:hypothetical protein